MTFDYIDQCFCSTQLNATQGKKKWLMFSIKLQWILFLGGCWKWCCQVEAGCVCEASRGWGYWLVDKDRGRLPGESTGNEKWIDQIYLLSVHFNKVRYQSSGVCPNGYLPQEHSVQNGTCHRPGLRTQRHFTGFKVWVCWWVLKSGAHWMSRWVELTDWSNQVLICFPFTNTLSSGVRQ